MTVSVTSYGMTDVGRRRDSNEDAFLDDDDLRLYAVADGMGGHAAGEIASSLAIESLASTVKAALAQPIAADVDRAEEVLRDAVSRANRRICESVLGRDEWRGMGTTVVAAILVGDQAVVAHVGDSRAYLMHEGSLTRLTSDHSWVSEQVRMGLLSENDAHRHPMRNIVTRALGNREDVDVEIRRSTARPGDVFLLCSDGLNTMLTDEEIRAALRDHAGDARAACEALVDAANRRGGEDNTTVVVVNVAGGP